MKIKLAFLVSTLAFTLASWVQAGALKATAPVTTAPAGTQAEYLFVIHASAGVVNQKGTETTLTLTNVDPQVLFFSDRPVRAAGLINMRNFMADWQKAGSSFTAIPPNAAIVHSSVKVDQKTGIAPAIAVELSHPMQVNANTWKFTMKNLSPTQLAPGKYKYLNLFIDDAGLCESVTNCGSPFSSSGGGGGYNTGD